MRGSRQDQVFIGNQVSGRERVEAQDQHENEQDKTSFHDIPQR